MGQGRWDEEKKEEEEEKEAVDNYSPGDVPASCSSSSSSPSSRAWRRLSSSSSSECVGFSSGDAEEGYAQCKTVQITVGFPQVQFLGKVVLSCVVQDRVFGPDSADSAGAALGQSCGLARCGARQGFWSRQCREPWSFCRCSSWTRLWSSLGHQDSFSALDDSQLCVIEGSGVVLTPGVRLPGVRSPVVHESVAGLAFLQDRSCVDRHMRQRRVQAQTGVLLLFGDLQFEHGDHGSGASLS